MIVTLFAVLLLGLAFENHRNQCQPALGTAMCYDILYMLRLFA